MAGTTTKTTWLALEKALSTDRLAGYCQPGDTDYDQAIARYLWNTALCEALYPVLHLVEVALRNRLDAALCRRFGKTWLNNEQLLSPVEIRRVGEAREKLAYRGKQEPTHADLVAELNLGFWVALFTKPYERTDRLWPRCAVDVMSGAPKSERRRSVFYERLDKIRDLRNRAFHYEPLWYWGDLELQHAAAVDFLTWLSPEVAELAYALDRFTEVRARGAYTYEGTVKGLSICPVHNGACRHLAGGPKCPSAPTANQ